MDSCNVKLPDFPIVDKLAKEYTNDYTRLVATVEAIFDKEKTGFNTEFNQFFRILNQSDENPNVDTTDSKEINKITEAAIAYINKIDPRISNKPITERDQTSMALYNYVNAEARDAGKVHVSNVILLAFRQVKFDGLSIEGNKLAYYIKKVIATWNGYIFKQAAARLKVPEAKLKKDYYVLESITERRDYIDKILGGRNKSSIAQNLYAVWCELNIDSKHAFDYVNDLFNNTLLNKVLDDTSRDAKELQDSFDAESNPELNNFSDTDNDMAPVDLDETFANYDHSGVKDTFTKQVSDVIRVYFDTLNVLTSDDLKSVERDKYFGLPTKMNSKECIQFLFSINEEFDNIDSMIEAIERAATNVSKFRAFYKLVIDLKNDHPFANEMFRVFGKPKFERNELRVTEDNAVTKVANERVSKETSMLFDFRNNVKSSINTTEAIVMREKHAEAISIVNNVLTHYKNSVNDVLGEAKRTEAQNKYKEAKEQAIVKITSILRGYFPDIEISAVRAYIEINNNGSNNAEAFRANCLNLLNDIDNLIKNHTKAKELYDQIEVDLSAIRDYNNKLNYERKKGNFVPKSKYKSETELKNIDFAKELDPAIKSLVTKLKPFYVGNIRLNDRNIYGNLQSSIINSSWLSGIKHMLDKFSIVVDEFGNETLKNDALVAWGTKKLIDTKQYQASTILLEQKDEQGNVLNPDTAIFRIVNGAVQLTKNANKILKVLVFQGSSNMTDGSNMDYSKMTSGDFFPTEYMMFFNTKDVNVRGLDIASYFPKTPSDAPNTFTFQSIKHDTTGLYMMSEEERARVDSDIREIIDQKVPLIAVRDYVQNYLNELKEVDKTNYVEIKDSELKEYLTNRRQRSVNNKYAIKTSTPVEESDTTKNYVSFRTESGITIVVEGTVERTNKGAYMIKNSKVVGVVAGNILTGERYETLPEEVYNALYDKYFSILDKRSYDVEDKTYDRIKYSINTSHPVYKMIRNQFIQEIRDAAIAVGHYFQLAKNDNNNNYHVALDGDKPILNPNSDSTRGYDNYHMKGGKLITYGNNKYHLTGDVFHFSNFTLNVNEQGKTVTKHYFEHLIDESTLHDEESGLINFLYGGALQYVCDVNGEKVVDIVLTDKQYEAIDRAMSNYLVDYFEQQTALVNKFKDFIKFTPKDRQSVVSFAANNLLMAFNLDYLLDGSPKFYKSNQDVIKRVKQFLASGTPYGSANYSAGFVPDLSPASHSYLNEGYIESPRLKKVKTKDGKIGMVQVKDENGKPIIDRTYIRDIFKNSPFGEIVQRNGFNAVTIENSKRTNFKALNELKQKLIKEVGLTEDRADDLLFGKLEEDKNGNLVRTKGYQNTKVNDAQSYITIQEFIRRLSAKGQLKRYMPLLRKLMDETKHISAKDITEFIQVQKNFYFDIWYDEMYGIEVPRQIKNAELVLVPRFIKGTQLEAVYNAMIKAGVDQLNTRETSKAANEKVLRLWDNNADIDEKVLDTFVKEASQNKRIYSYNNLYTQQETPQHMDSENKAGIQIIKKMLDNIPDKGHPLSEVKLEFYKVYCANIKEGCQKLLDRLEVPRDEKGNIIIEKCRIKGINNKVLYERMLEEARRTGVDDNQKDYFTFEEGSNHPLMMSCMNNYLSKFESIFQSMFNSAVTRQKLPGFHAAQVTNVGFKPYGNEINVSYAKELRYHPDGEPYIEIIVPYSALGIDKNSEHYATMDDEKILEELEAKGLDEIIGYRIPTEGKQSVAIMKIVGFIDDSMGSTIIVPDDWVSQTGSDFDIDSVYTITHEHFTTKSGEVKKYEYKKSNKRDIYDWFKYLQSAKVDTNYNTSEEIKKRNDEFWADFNNDFKGLQEFENEAFHNLSDELQDKIKKIDIEINERIEKKNLKGTEAYIERLSIKYNTLASDPNIKTVPELRTYADAINDILDALENREDVSNNAYRKNVDAILKDRFDTFNQRAKDSGLLTYEEYIKKENDLKANSKEARNSRICDIFLEILRHPSTLEENLSRSNFEHISEEKKAKMNPNLLTERAGRNPHNIADQVAYQEEVMSGRTLKGMSVALDTMCSVCNAVRPHLEQSVLVVYDENQIDKATAQAGFDVKHRNDGMFAIDHNTYGWSKNNKSVSGDILTTYSSETTAYILDNVKEGSIINLNSYTFGVFKTLANIGIDFGTIMSFIMQPGIGVIVDKHNAKNSVFNKAYGNEIIDAIKELCLKLDIEGSKDSNVATLLKNVNEKYGKKINEIFNHGEADGINFSVNQKAIAKIPIIARNLDERLQSTGRFSDINSEDSILHDIGVALTYMRLHRIALNIGKIASCCTADKFGAKATVYATRKLFEDIDDCIFRTEDVYDVDDIQDEDTFRKEKKERKPILSVDGKHILEAIYPGVANPEASKDEIIQNVLQSNDIQDSKYPPLYAFLKYATATSTILAKEVFETQDPVFVKVIEGLGQCLSGANKTLDEKNYNDFQRYMLATLYKKVPAIKYGVKVRKENNNIVLSFSNEDVNNNPNIDDKTLAEKETSRIWGYNHYNNLDVIVQETYDKADGSKGTRNRTVTVRVEDLNNPTDKEMELFEKLSPAQKVFFIQTNFNNSEIFELLNANLYNPDARGKWQGTQTLEFIDESTNSNEVYRMFKRAFESDNPLVVSTAIDLIKYSVQVEGFKMSGLAINKVIDNDALINDFNDGGLGFVANVRAQMRKFGTTKGFCGIADEIRGIYENYLRTMPSGLNIRNIYLNDTNLKKYNLQSFKYDTYLITQDNSDEDPVKNTNKFNKLLVSAGIKYNTYTDEEFGINKYIQLTRSGQNPTLYKIHDLGDKILLTPLSKLEANENTQWSAKESNNVGYMSPQAYDKLAKTYALEQAQAYNNEFITNFALKYAKEIENANDLFYFSENEKLMRPANPNFDIETLVAEDNGKAETLKRAIINHFSNITKQPLFVYNGLISDNIYTPGSKYGSIQKIMFPNGVVRTFNVSVPTGLSNIIKRYIKAPKGRELADISTIPFETLRPIIESAKKTNDTHLTNLGLVTEVNKAYAATVEDIYEEDVDEAYSAVVEDKLVDIINVGHNLNNSAVPGSDLFNITNKFKNNLYANDITSDVESVKRNELTSIRETASFVLKAASYIRNELFDRFMEDPNLDDSYIPITDSRVQDIIAENSFYMNKYFYAINMARDFLDKVTPITSEHSDDSQIQSYIDDIKNAIAKNLETLPLDELYRNAGNTILKTKSTNPLVQQRFLDVFDGYWRTYGNMWQFFSIMENGTPILQTILSDVMADINAKDKAKGRMLKRYRKDIDNIIERAKARGETIDIRKIINDNGEFYAKYKKEFADKLRELQNEVKRHVPGSIDHLKAKLVYDEFLLNHVNREADDEYYKRKLTIERTLLYGNEALGIKPIPELYSKYMTLYYQRQSIYDYAKTEDLSEEQTRELKMIEARMYFLYDRYEYIDENDNIQYRSQEEEDLDHPLYGFNSAANLAEALNQLSKLNEETFEQEAVKGFNRTLKANLNLIRRLERRVNDIPTVDLATLNENPQYVKAVDWIRNNAYFALEPQRDSSGNSINLAGKILDALKYLRRARNKLIYDPILDKEDIKDIKGIIDGRKLTKSEREFLKTSTIINVYPKGIDLHNRPGVELDVSLINNAKPKGLVFNAYFYNGLSSDTVKPVHYYQIVTELNELLAPYLGPIDGYIHFENIPDDAKGIKLLERVGYLYKQLSQAKGTDNTEDGSRNSDFIERNVEFVINETEFNRQIKALKDSKKSEAFREAMMNVIYVVNKDGTYPRDKVTGKLLPNKFLYSYAKPIGNPGDASYDKFVDSKEKESREILDKYYEVVPTQYYEYAKQEAIDNGTYDEWYKENHYYNPYTRKIEPIACWVTTRIKDEFLADNELEGKWKPKRAQSERRVKTGIIKKEINGIEYEYSDVNQKHNNDNYKPNEGHLANYKQGSGFDNDVELNQGEKEMLKYLQDTLMATANTNNARRYFAKGLAPKQAKSNLSVSKQIVKEIGKSIGVGLTENNGYSQFRQEIGFLEDDSPTMPMLSELNNKTIIDLKQQIKKLKEDTTDENGNPISGEVANAEAIKELEEQIRKAERDITDNNWYNVIENYLSKAADYNAVLDNKNKLYYLLNILKDMKMYSRKYGSYGELKKQRIKDDGTAIYQTSVDKNLIEQYENFLRRLFFNEWKEEEGRLTALGNFLQGYTSANYMMMNIRGGVANVTLGATGILAESAAKEYIGSKDWAFGNTEYLKGISSYGAQAYHRLATGRNRAYSKQGAIIEYMNVVDYDETTGILRNNDLSHVATEIRNALFSPQTMGEHYMQNSVLFAVFHSHKIFDTNQGIRAMSKNEYIAYRQYEMLDEILDADQQARFEEFKENLRNNKDELAKYAWFRSDALTKFIYINCSDEQIKEFIDKRKEQQKEIEKEFDSAQNIYEQLTLTNEGELGFVDGSELKYLDTIAYNTNGDVTSAERILGELSEKTRHINNKIHGIYNKREAAHIESKWYGGLIMQYHKHIPMGLLKRYMARGHWNEFRSSVDKGMVQSVIDFMSLNLEKVEHDFGFDKEEATALKSFMFQFTNCYKILSQMATTIQIVPEYEKANMLRNLGDLIGTVSAIATTAALWAIADDDNPDGFWFNFFLYESDRLSSEAFMYNPIGAINEGKKLMSTPVAAGSVINDAMNLLNGVVQWMFDDEYNPYYETGRWAGHSKLGVYLQRRIPIWNGIKNVIEITENNHAYKLGENAVSLIDIKDRVRD